MCEICLNEGFTYDRIDDVEFYLPCSCRPIQKAPELRCIKTERTIERGMLAIRSLAEHCAILLNDTLLCDGSTETKISFPDSRTLTETKTLHNEGHRRGVIRELTYYLRHLLDREDDLERYSAIARLVKLLPELPTKRRLVVPSAELSAEAALSPRTAECRLAEIEFLRSDSDGAAYFERPWTRLACVDWAEVRKLILAHWCREFRRDESPSGGDLSEITQDNWHYPELTHYGDFRFFRIRAGVAIEEIWYRCRELD